MPSQSGDVKVDGPQSIYLGYWGAAYCQPPRPAARPNLKTAFSANFIISKGQL
jgi:hypothetical protein